MRKQANHGPARLLVVCIDINEPGFIELVEQYAGPNIELAYVDSSEPDLDERLVDADCLLVAGGTGLSEHTLSVAERLKLVQLPQVGYNGIDLAAASRHGIAVCNAPGVNTSAVAEHALMLILATMRLARQHDDDIRSGRWPFMDFFDRGFGDFAGSTLGIVGLGGIGQALAVFSRPLAGEILYHQRHQAAHDTEARLGVRYVTLEDSCAAPMPSACTFRSRRRPAG